MLKIREINFIKNVYDESMSHQIFSVANIFFTNGDPIYGALLYWKENKDDELYTEENEYKFFYDVSETAYYATVKFPKYCTLSKAQKQELTFILLEQRGFIGSYSFQTDKNDMHVFFQIDKLFKKIVFPERFNPEHFKNYFHLLSDEEILTLREDYPFYSEAFLKTYSQWMQIVCQAHPAQFIRYLDYIQFTQLSYQNPFLTEQFIINHLNKIDWVALQYNLPVLDRLSKTLRMYLLEQLKVINEPIQQDIKESPTLFVEQPNFYKNERIKYLILDEIDNGIFGPFQYFEYDLGRNIWPGSEHMVKSIPSFAGQLYDVNGERKLTNKEMDNRIEQFTPLQMYFFETTCELHWLYRYKDRVNWKNVCLYNKHLTDAFIKKHEKYIDFESLAQNSQCNLSSDLIDHYFLKLLSKKVSPLILKAMNEDLYRKHATYFKLSKHMVAKVAHLLTDDQLEFLEGLIQK